LLRLPLLLAAATISRCRQQYSTQQAHSRVARHGMARHDGGDDAFRYERLERSHPTALDSCESRVIKNLYRRDIAFGQWRADLFSVVLLLTRYNNDATFICHRRRCSL